MHLLIKFFTYIIFFLHVLQIHAEPQPYTAADLKKSLYIELGPCAEGNYFHIVNDHLFPIFVTLANMGRERAFESNKIYCDKYPFKPEIFRLLSNYPVTIGEYNKTTMYKVPFRGVSESHEHFSRLLAQLHERFNIRPTKNNRHSYTITLVQRHSSRRMIRQFDKLCSKLQKYCTKRDYQLIGASFEAATFYNQIKLMGETDVLIAVHGAALTNAAFIRPHGTVIEIFPYNFRHFFFKDMLQKYRPDITYRQWTIPQQYCFPTGQMPKNQEIQFRYWRDQEVLIDANELWTLINSIRRPPPSSH